MITFWRPLGATGGAADYALESDTRNGVVYANGTKTGTLVVPAASDVRISVVFDNGTVGTYDANADLTEILKLTKLIRGLVV